MTFSFGELEQERVEIDVLRYEQPREFHDDEWLAIQITVCVGQFSGKIDAAILTKELVLFVEQLRPLFETLHGSAEFVTLEDQLNLRLSGDGRGHIKLKGHVADRPGDGNQLNFNLDFDQSQLGVSIQELEKVIAEFPFRKL
jgi:hypothetical protein